MSPPSTAHYDVRAFCRLAAKILIAKDEKSSTLSVEETTATPLRAAIYLRVSDKRQLDNHSLDAQERLGRDMAAREGWVIPDYALYRDEAQRGGRADRPEFLRLIADIEAGRLDVVIVYWQAVIARMVQEESAQASTNDQDAKRRAALDERLGRAKKLYLLGDLTDAQYADEKADIERERAKLAPATHTTTAVPVEDYSAAVETLKNFGQLYERANLEQRKELFHLIMERVVVFQNEIAAIQPRLAFYPIFYNSCGPDELPELTYGGIMLFPPVSDKA
jgi:hypothetical protein